MCLILTLGDGQEEDIDQMILDAKACEQNQGMRRRASDRPQWKPELGVNPTEEEQKIYDEERKKY